MELCGAVNAMRSSCYRDDYFCGVFDRNLWNVCWIWSVYPSISLASSLHFQCPGKKKRKKKNSDAPFISVCCANNAHSSTLASWPRLIRLGDSLSHYLNALCFSVTPSSAGHRQQPFQPGFDHPRISASLPHIQTHRGTH